MYVYGTNVDRYLCTYRSATTTPLHSIYTSSPHTRTPQQNPIISHTQKAEVPFPCEMVVVHAPGAVLSDLLAYSRRFALQEPPVEKGGYLQVALLVTCTCDDVYMYNTSVQVTT